MDVLGPESLEAKPMTLGKLNAQIAVGEKRIIELGMELELSLNWEHTLEAGLSYVALFVTQKCTVYHCMVYDRWDRHDPDYVAFIDSVHTAPQTAMLWSHTVTPRGDMEEDAEYDPQSVQRAAN